MDINSKPPAAMQTCRCADVLATWLAEGRLHPLITARYPFGQTAQALDDLMNRRVSGR